MRAQRAAAWWPFSGRRLVLSVGLLPVLKKSALTVLVTKPDYYTKVQKSFRAMDVKLSTARCTQRQLPAHTALHLSRYLPNTTNIHEEKWQGRLLITSWRVNELLV